jgi:hypothetical protein
VRQPGPVAGFYQRARRGHSIAIVASARKIAGLFRCLLTCGEDYAFAQPSLTKKKMRRLELQAGAPRWQGGRGVWPTNEAMRDAERELPLQAQPAYERMSRTASNQGARARHRAAHLVTRQASKSRGRPQALGLARDGTAGYARLP